MAIEKGEEAIQRKIGREKEKTELREKGIADEKGVVGQDGLLKKRKELREKVGRDAAEVGGIGSRAFQISENS